MVGFGCIEQKRHLNMRLWKFSKSERAIFIPSERLSYQNKEIIITLGADPEVRHNNTEESVLYYIRKYQSKFFNDFCRTSISAYET